MTWNECLALGATKLAAILNCPVTTAHSWIRRSGPAEWLQPILAAYVTKKHNKAMDGTPGKRPKKSSS
jgi:hypothetical protein